MNRMIRASLLLAAFTILLFTACKHQPAIAEGDYPAAINELFMNRCATAGCHNAASASGAAGLRMDQWDRLFDGSVHGAVVIPYDIINSPLLHYINTDSTVGHVGIPTMPLNSSVLTKDEYNIIRDWIAAGAPDKNGNIPFGANADKRQKIYLTEQGSNTISVIDAERKVLMRNIVIGKTGIAEYPHNVVASGDGKFIYATFLLGDVVEKIDTRTDALVGEVKISNGNAQWNTFRLSPDGNTLMLADVYNGNFTFINTTSMTVASNIQGSGIFKQPHSIAANAAFDTFYVAAHTGNVVYQLFRNGASFASKSISIDGNPVNADSSLENPEEIMMTPGDSTLWVTCAGSNEVRLLNIRTQAIMAIWTTPDQPQSIAMSTAKPYLFVTCQAAASPVAGAKGCVIVYDYVAMQEVTRIFGDFYEPHAVVVDDVNKLFYVITTQSNANGAASHHGNLLNGWYSIYNLNDFQPVNAIRYETLSYPYSAAARFRQ